VTVDDRIPVDLFGRALLVGSRPLQLWPLLLCKAILKVMAVYRTLDMTLPHQVGAVPGSSEQQSYAKRPVRRYRAHKAARCQLKQLPSRWLVASAAKAEHHTVMHGQEPPQLSGG
jgi:hypothetical protein